MNISIIKTPGVYINEINAFPNAVVPVPTAVPAFIGYTPQALYEDKSYTNVAQKITSFAEFKAMYCYPESPAIANPKKQYSPQYYLVKQNSQPDKGPYIELDGRYYAIVPDANTIYYLYNSVRLFYENGGGDAYIVSVGSYGEASKQPTTPGTQIINTNVKLNELLKGLAILKKEEEPTMYCCPEATLLSVADNATLMQEMLLQNTEMKTAISIFDVIGGNDPDPILYINDIETFRNSTGTKGLCYGVAYYPFIETALMQNSDIDYTNLFGGDLKQLATIINPSEHPNEGVTYILANIENPSGLTLTIQQNNNALLTASKTFRNIINQVLKVANILPPSGGMAGVITITDNQIGPWQAPANKAIVGTVDLPIYLSEKQQLGLNADAVSGKSVNAIRKFNGLGFLIWGARTLDGNSMDWKYLSVRRTVTMLEQSCKLATKAYVFEPNDRNTWEVVKAMIANFLNSIWKEGGLQVATPADAYSVECGLGTTMTSTDLLEGRMNVTVKVAVVRPAEFMVLTFSQEMAKSS